MKTLINIILITTQLIFFGCEVEEIISTETVYVEYTVVQAELHPERLFPGVRFTKTLPLGVPYDLAEAELKNVTAYIVKNEVQVIPLLYTSEGMYEPLYEFFIHEGETYELYAELEEKYIYGRTIIPQKPNVASVNFNPNDYYFEADVHNINDEVYAALWIVTGTPPAKADDFFSVTTPSTGYNIIKKVQTSSLPEEYRNNSYNGSRNIQVFSFDKSFSEYFYSRTSGQQINDPFIQGGGVVEWNVQGENVIGMFIGVTPGDVINVN